MKKLSFLIIALLMLAGVVVGREKKDKRTPFPKVEYRENLPYVEYQQDWVKLISIEGKPVGEYIEYAQDMEPSDWKFCFTRYLHYIMDDMKMERGKTVKVTFEQNGIIITKDFELKKENRDLATGYMEKLIGENRIQRKHSSVVPADLKYLQHRLDGYAPAQEDWIGAEEAIHDLEHLEWQIVNNYSYADLRHFDYKTALDVIRMDLRDGISKRDFALQLKMFMANFGDGHSRVSMRYIFAEKSELLSFPFQVIKEEEGFVAVNVGEKTFYNKDYPQLLSVNGIPTEEFYDIAERFIPKTTSKFVERNALDYLSFSGLMLKLAGKEINKSVTLCFGNGEKQITEEVDLQKYNPQGAMERSHFKKEIMDGNLGYLAFQEHMDDEDEFIESLHKAMGEFKNTNGLIIDIRGNGGGSRAPLKALLPYFIKEPKVTNVARYRIDAEKDIHPKNGYLPARYAYPFNYEAYTKAERKAIKKVKRSFKPVRSVSDDKFTEYHYMVVSPTKEHGIYYYNKPVIVLVDEGCFSASDIFAAGIRQGDNVRLLGNTTGGGSGFSKSRRLPNSRIKVKMSRIYSYQPDGNMYDGHGVIPDIKKDYTLTDRFGLTDTQLSKAKLLLTK
ncbi:S41 family peptidase [Marinifilum flexuosum]|nr:S41 family peptidase [Marinifilum flexuosum]